MNIPLVGFASPDLPPEQYENYLNWLKDGNHSDMNYLARDPQRRKSVLEIMPEAKTVIVLGLPYYSKPQSPKPERFAGRVSQYATGRDYHRLMEKKTKRICREIEALSKSRCKAYVDYGPVMERAYAVSAGLGFIGKNSCLINPKWGSYFFLAIIITDLEIEQDKPMQRDCGKCRACLDACPTGALERPFILNSRKCLSYHSIENKGSIPEHVYKNWKGNWIFGCDTCQEACPYNKKAPETPEPDLRETKIESWVDIPSLFDIQAEEFKERFQGSPINRAGRTALLRNCAICLANSGEEGVKTFIASAIEKESDEELLRHLYWLQNKLKARNSTN